MINEETQRVIDDLNAKVEELSNRLSGIEANNSTEVEEIDPLYDDDLRQVEVGVTQDEDENVAVDDAAVPGYLGAASSDGVLRTGSGLTYVDGEHFVTLDTKYNNDGGGSGAGEGLPVAFYEGQVSWWDYSASKWVLSKSENVTGPAVLVYDSDASAGNKVRWQTIGTKFKTIHRNTAGDIEDDWVRAHV